eukprot:1908831-Pyramimonas_sp.AAC.1
MGKGHIVLTAIAPLDLTACTGIARVGFPGEDRLSARQRLTRGCLLRSSQTSQGRACSRAAHCYMGLSRRVAAHRAAPLWSTDLFLALTPNHSAVQGRASWTLPSATSSFIGRGFQRD